MKINDESTTQKYADAIRTMIIHEDELLNNRMNWLLVVQGLLFSALPAVKNTTGLVYLLIAFGFLISISSKVAFIAGDRAIRNLLAYWAMHLKSTKQRWQNYPPVFGAAIDKSLFMKIDSILSPRKILPWAFALGWIIILIIELKA